jgi:hypothetical protein
MQLGSRRVVRPCLRSSDKRRKHATTTLVVQLNHGDKHDARGFPSAYTYRFKQSAVLVCLGFLCVIGQLHHRCRILQKQNSSTGLLGKEKALRLVVGQEGLATPVTLRKDHGK